MEVVVYFHNNPQPAYLFASREEAERARRWWAGESGYETVRHGDGYIVISTEYARAIQHADIKTMQDTD